MEQCHFCLCPLEEKAGFRVPGNAMCVAIQNGFNPQSSPSWETMKNTAYKLISDYEMEMSEEDLVQRWKERLSRFDRRWHVCEKCFAAVQPHLPSNPNQVPDLNNQNFATTPEDKALGWVIPANVSVWAILAGYFGLLSVLLLPAPIALILGLIALYDVKTHPGRTGMGRAIFAIIMGILAPLLIVLLIVATT